MVTELVPNELPTISPCGAMDWRFSARTHFLFSSSKCQCQIARIDGFSLWLIPFPRVPVDDAIWYFTGYNSWTSDQRWNSYWQQFQVHAYDPHFLFGRLPDIT